MKFPLIGFAALLLSLLAVAHAEVRCPYKLDQSQCPGFLVGVAHVPSVFVHLDEETEREGLTEASLGKAARERLNRNGVPHHVETLAVLRTSPSPWLEVTVTAFDLDLEFRNNDQVIDPELMVYVVNVELTEYLTIYETGHVERSSIWRQGYLGTSGTEELAHKVQDAMLIMIDELSIAWHAANANS